MTRRWSGRATWVNPIVMLASRWQVIEARPDGSERVVATLAREIDARQIAEELQARYPQNRYGWQLA